MLNVAASAEPFSLKGLRIEMPAMDCPLFKSSERTRRAPLRAATATISASQIPDARLIFDLEGGDDIARCGAIDAPGRVRVDDPPRLWPGQRLPDLSGGVDVELLKHLRAENPGTVGPKRAQQFLGDLALAPRVNIVRVDQDVRLDECPIARAVWTQRSSRGGAWSGCGTPPEH